MRRWPTMTARVCLAWAGLAWTLAAGMPSSVRAEEDSNAPAKATAALLAPIDKRFAAADVAETPDFQRHVAPLLGRLGCNGRSCHGSFQGRGGFRLSLFGFDFKFDHEALAAGDKPRINLEKPDESLVITKPTDANNQEGGERYSKGSWQHHVLRKWIADGGKYDTSSVQTLKSLEVTPAEVVAAKAGENVAFRATAVWADGSREDVTPLCRFQSNDDQIAKIDEHGRMTTGDVGDTHIVVFYDNAVVPVAVIRPVSDQTGPKYPAVAAPTKVDELIVEKLRKLGILPSDVCTDAEFLRRVSLDLTGTLPSAADVEAFLQDSSPNKRVEKINELLDTPAYAAWWATKLCDFTGNNDRQLNNVNNVVTNAASQGWYDWIYKRIAANTPYDQIAEGIILGKSRLADQSYRDFCKEMSDIYRPGSDRGFADLPSMPYYWARTNMRQTEDKAIAFAYSFMGVRIQCAQCHKHPFDQWSKDDFDQFKQFFAYVRYSQVGPKDEMQAILDECGLKDLRGNDLRRKLPDLLKEGKTVPFGETVAASAVRTKAAAAPQRGKGTKNAKAETKAAVSVKARLLNGEMVELTEFKDAREPVMAWLRSKDNPYFARAFVNRVWATYFNAGIVEPPDDMSLANPPRNKALLDYLSTAFIEKGFDIKWLHREICNSATYQRSWKVNETNAKDERNFSRAVPRRLPAEVAVDALQQAVASDAKASDAYVALKGRAITVPGSSAQVRGNGGGDRGFALQVFGRSTRESNCDCDRSTEASLLQTVYLQNDSTVIAAINGGRDSWIEQLTKQAKASVVEDGGKADRQAAEAKAELAILETRLAALEKRKLEAQITRVKERIAMLEKQLKEAKAAKPAAAPVKLDPATIARQAYLRTLSRLPTDEEAARSIEFITTSTDSLEGAKGLLWALVNTKEFIVNH
ncbi:MAG: DUF1549 and DUF1553 domain-containing protein [Planctomycetota bacterium]